MRVEYYHASEYGNGAKVAEEFRRLMAAKGVTVNVHHVKDAKPAEVPPADLYLFSSPGRFGKPIKSMRKFLKKANLPPGSRYALLCTELNPTADDPNAKAPAGDKLGPCQQIIPILNETLQAKGLERIMDGKVFVTGIQGPLEKAWQGKVEEYVKVLVGAS